MKMKKYHNINISGKNISFINHNNILYFIHYIKPFELYTFNIETSETLSSHSSTPEFKRNVTPNGSTFLQIIKIEVDDDKNSYNYEYRGGTPGYKMNDNEYYGIGHRTYCENSIIKHDIFKWIVTFENDKLPRIKHFDIEQPSNSKNICDPTSVIEINNKNYLITAETDYSWFCEQDYITNVYEII